jgi:hypothetical protein
MWKQRDVLSEDEGFGVAESALEADGSVMRYWWMTNCLIITLSNESLLGSGAAAP